MIESFLLAVSLAADCFAVTTCSSVGIGKVSWKTVIRIALVFGLVQTGLMLAGWLLGDLFVGYIQKAAKIIGFLLLLYVGGSMLIEAFRNECESMNLGSLRNVFIGALATSLDALSVGLSLSMTMPSPSEMAVDAVMLFLVTVLSVIGGIFGGRRIGGRFGRPAELFGGIVLIMIGVNILFDFI